MVNLTEAVINGLRFQVSRAKMSSLVPQQCPDLIAVNAAGSEFNAAFQLQQVLTVEGGID